MHTGSRCYCTMTVCRRVPATGPFESDPLVIVRRKGLISHQIKCPLSFSVCFHSLFFPCSPLLLSSPPFSAVPRVTQVTTTIQLLPPLTMYCLAFPSPPLPLSPPGLFPHPSSPLLDIEVIVGDRQKVGSLVYAFNTAVSAEAFSPWPALQWFTKELYVTHNFTLCLWIICLFVKQPGEADKSYW